MSKRPEYGAWASMRRRCANPSDNAYRYYGGRGITVCERWQKFENFYADMGPRPSPMHSIDRIDNDGNYEPGNCRWATRVQQIQNRRKSREAVANRQWLRDARNYLGWSTYELGRRCDLSHATVTNYELGADSLAKNVHKMWRVLEEAGAFKEESGEVG
jgi:hypothetical protein